MTDYSVKVKIFSATLEKGLIELVHHYRKTKGEEIDLDKVLVLNSIIKNKKINFSGLSELPYINKNLLKNILNELLNLELIETTGKTKDFYYLIHKSRLSSISDQKKYLFSKKLEKQKQQEIILRFLDEFPEIDNNKAREILNLSSNQYYLVSKLFKQMLKKDLIYIAREIKHNHYIYKRKIE